MPALLQRLFCLLASALLLSTSAYGNEVLRISGASTIQPILKRTAPEFTAATGILLNISGGGSAHGITAVLAGEADIGMLSRSPSDEEAKILEVTRIGYDALALVVHESNALDDLTHDQVRDIFQGNITEWQSISPRQSGMIARVGKAHGRSTRLLFDQFFGLTAADYPKNLPIVGADASGILYVSIDPQAIAYISAGSILRAIRLGAPVKLLSIDGKFPKPDLIRNADYPYGRPLNLVTRNPQSPKVRQFLDWITHHEKGQQAVEAEGFLAIGTQP